MGHVQESVEILSCRMCPAGKYTYSIEQNRKGVQNKFTWEMKKNCVDQMVGLPAEAEAGVCPALPAMVVKSMESHLWSLSLRITCNL